jgi:hypothetical protein
MWDQQSSPRRRISRSPQEARITRRTARPLGQAAVQAPHQRRRHCEQDQGLAQPRRPPRQKSGKLPGDFGVNAVWLELSVAAIDVPAWTRVLLLDGDLAIAEPKKLRHRLLHVAARLTHGGRLRLRISATWPARRAKTYSPHRTPDRRPWTMASLTSVATAVMPCPALVNRARAVSN